MDHKSDIIPEVENQIVYVRAVSVAELPKEMRAAAGDLKEVYAIFSEEGKHLAFVKDRSLAFAVARTNEMAPVSVH